MGEVRMAAPEPARAAVAQGSGRCFFEFAANDPGRAAVIDADGARVSYGDLLTLVNRSAHGLRETGLRSGDTLAAIMPNSAEFLALLLATSQLGIVLVPVNWHFTVPEISYLLTDSGARSLVTGAEFAVTAAAAADAAGLPRERRYAAPAAPGFRPFTALAAGQPDTRPDGLAFAHPMLYTSGTTGRPKGVARPVLDANPDEISALITAALTVLLGLVPGDGVHLVTAPMYHASPGTHALYALHLGHTVVISPAGRPTGPAPRSGTFDAVTMLDLVERHRVTNTFMVPTMFHRLLALPASVREAADTSALRQVLHAAAACPAADKRKMIDWLGPVLVEYYGSTESAIVVVADSHEWLAHPGTVGHPVLGIDIKILDEAGDELPTGTPGLIYASVADGFAYHKDPAKTSASRRGGYYTPGDIGYLDEDGYLYLCDRRSDLIISGGVNIYPAEVEAALLEHPAVADAAVFGVPDPEWGQLVTALVQPADGVAASPELGAEILAHCAGRLARFKHPRTLEFAAALPRTPTGKLSRSRVREEYLAHGA
jgi:long-chain acyl-CoA synthetase